MNGVLGLPETIDELAGLWSAGQSPANKSSGSWNDKRNFAWTAFKRICPSVKV